MILSKSISNIVILVHSSLSDHLLFSPIPSIVSYQEFKYLLETEIRICLTILKELIPLFIYLFLPPKYLKFSLKLIFFTLIKTKYSLIYLRKFPPQNIKASDIFKRHKDFNRDRFKPSHLK